MTVAAGIRLHGAPRSASLRAFGAMVMRDLRVMRRDFAVVGMRSVVQPLLLVFVFAYVMPSIGTTLSSSQANVPFSTILLPGAVASTMLITGVVSVMSPLLVELTFNREIEDRLLAPLPVWSIAVEKIIVGAIQSLLTGAIVFPLALLIHPKGLAPVIDVHDWALLVVVVLAGSLFAAAIGLFFGTVADVRRGPSLLAVGLLPITMLGCVYYPWAALHSIRWLQVITLFNPLVYMSEGLRASLTPGVPHLPLWSILAVLGGGCVLMSALSIALFQRKVRI
ncbi:MAG TPA: ABC transporter permease [Streptosporangiaceae bacterium]|jgi:ABC-2 type transport system permease protein|nr:ABC transporter permease [Streptosporangiaceae bacterium]